jgi:hypothetical protein
MRDLASLPQQKWATVLFSIRSHPASRLSFFHFQTFNKNSLFHSEFFYIFLIFDVLFWTTNRPYPFSATPHPPIPYPSSIPPPPLHFSSIFQKNWPLLPEFLLSGPISAGRFLPSSTPSRGDLCSPLPTNSSFLRFPFFFFFRVRGSVAPNILSLL